VPVIAQIDARIASDATGLIAIRVAAPPAPVSLAALLLP
jgi:hypothetical protein